jgi:AcrR family transcriptional regulator
MNKEKKNRPNPRRDVIIAKAAMLFRKNGYVATSMRDLAEEVGVEAASLYNHISSKSEILQDICFRVANKFMLNIDEVSARPISALEKVELILRFHIREMINNYEEVNVSDREWRHLPEPYLLNFQNQRKIYRQKFASLIEEGIRSGEINEIDAPTAVIIMLHAVSGIESWHRSVKKIDADQLEKNMVMILIHGLKKNS